MFSEYLNLIQIIGAGGTIEVVPGTVIRGGVLITSTYAMSFSVRPEAV